MYYTDTRPNIYILDDGICTSCNISKEKKKLIGEKRKLILKKLYKKLNLKKIYMIALSQLVVEKIVLGRY